MSETFRFAPGIICGVVAEVRRPKVGPVQSEDRNGGGCAHTIESSSWEIELRDAEIGLRFEKACMN